MMMEAFLLTPYLAITSSLALAAPSPRLLQPVRPRGRGFTRLDRSPRGAGFTVKRFRLEPMASTRPNGSSFLVRGDGAARPAPPEVIVHDPGAQRPHDLDDPFFDPEVQSRHGGRDC